MTTTEQWALCDEGLDCRICDAARLGARWDRAQDALGRTLQELQALLCYIDREASPRDRG